MSDTVTAVLAALQRRPRVTLRGRLDHEDDDAIAVRQADMVFEVPKRHVLGRVDDERVSPATGATEKMVDLSIDPAAKIIQRSPVHVPVVPGPVVPDAGWVGQSSECACACACACNCACDCACDCACACGGCGCTGQVFEGLGSLARFRTRLRA